MGNRGPNLLRAQRRPPCRWQRLVSTTRRLLAIPFRIALPMRCRRINEGTAVSLLSASLSNAVLFGRCLSATTGVPRRLSVLNLAATSDAASRSPGVPRVPGSPCSSTVDRAFSRASLPAHGTESRFPVFPLLFARQLSRGSGIARSAHRSRPGPATAV